MSESEQISLEGFYLLTQETNETANNAGVSNQRRSALEMAWECPYKGKTMLNKETGELVPFDCKSWNCPVHGPGVAYRWQQRLAGIPWDLMITLTKVNDDPKEARKQWQVVARELRKWGMRTFVRVLEAGEEHGMLHWHILERGIKRVDFDRLRSIAETAGLGEWVHAVKVHERRGAGSYVTKYATKALGDHRASFRGFRRITCSRDVGPYRLIREAKARNDPTKDTEQAPGDWVLR